VCSTMVMSTTPDGATALQTMLPFKGNGTNVQSRKSKRRRHTHFIAMTQQYSYRLHTTSKHIGERMDPVCLEVHLVGHWWLTICDHYLRMELVHLGLWRPWKILQAGTRQQGQHVAWALRLALSMFGSRDEDG
jgi:hypothetical protein